MMGFIDEVGVCAFMLLCLGLAQALRSQFTAFNCLLAELILFTKASGTLPGS
jgi:hypothetical protein